MHPLLERAMVDLSDYYGSSVRFGKLQSADDDIDGTDATNAIDTTQNTEASSNRDHSFNRDSIFEIAERNLVFYSVLRQWKRSSKGLKGGSRQQTPERSLQQPPLTWEDALELAIRSTEEKIAQLIDKTPGVRQFFIDNGKADLLEISLASFIADANSSSQAKEIELIETCHLADKLLGLYETVALEVRKSRIE